MNPMTVETINWTLTADRIIKGPLDLKGGAIDLAGKTLTVQGDLIHSRGTLNINGGKLIIQGDYRIQTPDESSDGYTYSYGYLSMTNALDSIEIQGDFFMDSRYDHSGRLTQGTLTVIGDFTQLSSYGADADDNFEATSDHKVILAGNSVQTVHFDDPHAGTSDSHFNILEIKNTSAQGVVFETGIVVTTLFDHNGNNYTFTGSFQLPDFDADGVSDEMDTDPETAYTCDSRDLKSIYRDFDGDGYGNAAIAMQSCELINGYVEDNTDCDDTKQSIHPGAIEICNGIDDNCNGQVDEGVCIPGDLNGDLDVNLNDVKLVLQCITGKDVKGLQPGYANSSGADESNKISPEQAIYILQKSSNSIP